MELTDIPINLQQNDSAISTTSAETKEKSNSLKRFFKCKKSNVSLASSSTSGVCIDATKSEQMDPTKNCERAFRKFQIRSGSSKYTNPTPCSASNAELSTPGLNRKVSSTKSHTESSHRLQGFFSNYWHQVFKKTDTGSSAAAAADEMSNIGESMDSTESTNTTQTRVIDLTKEDDDDETPSLTPRDERRRSQSPTTGI